MPVELRMATPNDVSEMAALRAQTAGTSARWTDRIGGYLSGEHSPQQALPERVIFVAVDGGKMVGLVAGHQTRRFGCDGELQWIDVDRERRGLGIGRWLIARIGAWFVSVEAQRICVNVATENRAARTLYAHCGAQPLHEGWMVWEESRTMARDPLQFPVRRSSINA